MRRSLRSHCLVVIFALTIMGRAASSNCAKNHSHPAPTPPQWAVGSTWTVTVLSIDHKPIGSMVVRLTGKKAKSCMAGDWKQVEILKRQFKDQGLLATTPLSYSIVGNQLTLGVTEICDGYVFLQGSLTDTAGDSARLLR